MKFGNFVFRPGLWPTLAALFFFALTLYLGNWQLSRAEYKKSLQAHYDSMQKDGVVQLGAAEVNIGDVRYRTVEMRGSFVKDAEILIDNRVYKTLAGYHVLTPFLLEGTRQHVLVNRGWVAVVGRQREVLPSVKPVNGVVSLRGVAVEAQGKYFQFEGAVPQGRLWQNLDFAQYRQRFGKPLHTLLVEQVTDTGDGLVRDWPRPDTGVDTHISYAIQWFGLAATLVVLWLVLNTKRINDNESETL